METALIEKDVENALTTARNIVVRSNEEEAFALEFCKIIKKCQKEVGDEYDEVISKAHTIHKDLVAKKKKYLDPLKEAEDKIRDAIKSYRLDLELERQAQEKKAKEDAEASLQAEKDRLLKEAEAAKSSGDDDKADELALKSATIENGGVFVTSKAVKQEGMSSSIIWKGRVSDVNKLPKEYLTITPNQKAIDAHIKLNGSLRAIPGVEYYQDVNLSVRSS